jgi:hypothetical protein
MSNRIAVTVNESKSEPAQPGLLLKKKNIASAMKSSGTFERALCRCKTAPP